jgi:hypothetical protein
MPTLPAALYGALRIEQAIIDRLRPIHITITITADHMVWNGGKALFPTPALVTLTITAPALPVVSYIFTSEELQAAADFLTLATQAAPAITRTSQ